MEQPGLLQRLLDLLPRASDGGVNLFVIVGGVVALVVVLLVLRALARALFGGKAGPTQERGVGGEDLASYPPPPPPGARRLTFEGIPVRLRLVVLAPTGKQNPIDPAGVEPLLEQVLRGLGVTAQQDRPRVSVWPAQLSNQGFAATFHRTVHRPEADGQPSRWILVAGQTPARPRPLLVGLALLADEPNAVGKVTLSPDQWADALRHQG